MLVQENRYVPTQITGKGTAFLATEVIQLRVQLLAAWLHFKLQNRRTSPQNKNMRRHILTSSQFNLTSTSHKLQPALSPAPGHQPDVKPLVTAVLMRRKKAANLWLGQMFAVTARNLLLLPVRLKVKHHEPSGTSTPQSVGAPRAFGSELLLEFHVL